MTYPYGLDVNGDSILNKLYSIGIDATYINAGILRSTDGSNQTNLTNEKENENMIRGFSKDFM